MYLTIDTTDYTELMNLSFAPQIDMTVDSLPINEFSVDIKTDDDIEVGQYAELYDDLDNLWAKYWLVYAEHTSEHVVSVRARSELDMLEHVELEEVMYNGDLLSDVLDDTMVRQAGSGIVAVIDYDLDSSLSAVTVTGYCPAQTARERLQWLLFTSGAYVQTFFNDRPTIKPLDETITLIPLEKIYWRPAVTYDDYVTSIKVTAYTFSQAAQATDDSSYVFPPPWVATEQVYTLNNTDAPSGIADNIVEIDGLYLVNTSNVSAILTRLARRYFKRASINADVIDNAEYIPGDKITIYTDAATLFDGFIEQAQFAFGVQAKATLKIVSLDTRPVGVLKITYVVDGGDLDGMELSEEWHGLPVDYEYDISTRQIDRTVDGHRYILVPTVSEVDGTMGEQGANAQVECNVALDYYKPTSDGKPTQITEYHELHGYHEYDSRDTFPDQGVTGDVYVEKSTGTAFKWTGTGYAEVSGSEVEDNVYVDENGTAYRWQDGTFAANMNDDDVSGIVYTDSNNNAYRWNGSGMVSDISVYDDVSSFPATGEIGRIYVDSSTGNTYQWNGTRYVGTDERQFISPISTGGILDIADLEGVDYGITISGSTLTVTDASGGTATFLNQEDIALVPLAISLNGTYKASDIGVYGYSKAKVEVPHDSVTGTIDGTEYIITVDGDGYLVYTPA